MDNINQNITRLVKAGTIDSANAHKFFLSFEHPSSGDAQRRQQTAALGLSPNSPATKLLIDEVPLPI